jgi:hypothetical protein
MGDEIVAKRKQLIKGGRGPHDEWARQQYENDKGKGSCKADKDLVVPCPGERLLSFGVFSPMRDLDFDDKTSKLEYYTWFNRAYARRRGADSADTWPDAESELPGMSYADLNEESRESEWESTSPWRGVRYEPGNSHLKIRKNGKEVRWTVENYRLAFIEKAVSQDRVLSEEIAKARANIKCSAAECALTVLEGDKADPYKPNAWDYVARNTNIHVSEGATARTRVAVCIKFFAVCTLKHNVIRPTKARRLDMWAFAMPELTDELSGGGR